MRVSMAFRLTAASEIKGDDRDAPHQHLSRRHMEVTLLFFLQPRETVEERTRKDDRTKKHMWT